MKKILLLLSVISIAESPIIAVSACGSATSDHDSIDSILQKIQNIDVDVPSDTPLNLQSSKMITALRVGLIAINSNTNLTNTELQNTSFAFETSGSTIQYNSKTVVVMTINYKGRQGKKKIKVSLSGDANYIKSTIKNPKIDLGYLPEDDLVLGISSWHDIGEELIKNNTEFNPTFFNHLVMPKDVTLKTGANPIKIMIITNLYGSKTSTEVELGINVEDKTAKNLASVITNKKITLGSNVDPNLQEPATIKAISELLIFNNMKLTMDDLQYFSYNNKDNSVPATGKPTPVNLVISYKGFSATVELMVTNPEVSL